MGLVVLFTVLFHLTRPEGVFVLIGVLITLLIWYTWVEKHKPYIKKVISLVNVNMGIFILIAGIRYFYFGMIFPQPVFAKSEGLSYERFLGGMEYFMDFLYGEPTNLEPINILIFLMMVLGLNWLTMEIVRKNISLDHVLLHLFVFVYVGFIVASGGDWMVCYRFFGHIASLLVLVIFCNATHWIKKRNILTQNKKKQRKN